jgi:hypothetical protein
VGSSESLQDIIYLVAITHILALGSAYAWLLLLLAPARAALWVWRTFLGPYFFSGADAGADAAGGRAGGRKAKPDRRAPRGVPRR